MSQEWTTKQFLAAAQFMRDKGDECQAQAQYYYDRASEFLAATLDPPTEEEIAEAISQARQRIGDAEAGGDPS